MLERFRILFHRNDMLDYLCIIFLQIIIGPCEDILVLFEKFNECCSFSRRTISTKVDILRILFRVEVEKFIFQWWAIFIGIHWFLKFVLKVKIFLHPNNIHRNKITESRLIFWSWSLENGFVLFIINHWCLESVFWM